MLACRKQAVVEEHASVLEQDHLLEVCEGGAVAVVAFVVDGFIVGGHVELLTRLHQQSRPVEAALRVQ